MDRSFGKQDPRIILRSRLPAEPRSSAIGTIPVDPSDDAGDGGGNSQGVSPASRVTDPNSHTPVGLRLAAVHRTRHLRFQENHRHRTGYVDNSLPRVLAHTHCATTTALSLQNPMVDPKRTLRRCNRMALAARMTARLTAQFLRQIGVNVEVLAMDWSTLASRRAEKKSVEDPQRLRDSQLRSGSPLGDC